MIENIGERRAESVLEFASLYRCARGRRRAAPPHPALRAPGLHLPRLGWCVERGANRGTSSTGAPPPGEWRSTRPPPAPERPSPPRCSTCPAIVCDPTLSDGVGRAARDDADPHRIVGSSARSSPLCSPRRPSSPRPLSPESWGHWADRLSAYRASNRPPARGPRPGKESVRGRRRGRPSAHSPQGRPRPSPGPVMSAPSSSCPPNPSLEWPCGPLAQASRPAPSSTCCTHWRPAAIAGVRTLCERLGVVLNTAKMLGPATRVKYLGLILDSEAMTLSIDVERAKHVYGLW